MKRVFIGLGLAIAVFVACSKGEVARKLSSRNGVAALMSAPMANYDESAKMAAAPLSYHYSEEKFEAHDQIAGAAASQTASTGSASLIPKAPANRKVIYQGSLEITVNSVKIFRDAFEELVIRSGGFVASSSIAEPKDASSTGRYVVRLPSGQLRSFLHELATFGAVQKENIGSNDVTDAYFDLDARLNNARRTEARILSLLATHTARLTDVIEVEHELARIRETIETFEGRKRLWDSQVELATLTVVFSMQQKAIAPHQPTFAEKIARGFRANVDQVVDNFQAATVGVISFVPWLLPLTLLLAIAFPIVQRVRLLTGKLEQVPADKRIA